MTKKLLPLATSTWDDSEKNAAIAVIESDKLTMGPKVAEFEAEFAKYFGSKYAVMVNSGSSANLLAIAALRYKKENPLQPGDEIIVPSLSWSTTYYPVNQCGMTLVFVDIDADTFNIDIEQIKSAITGKTKAIFVPNILGNPADLIALKAFCDEKNIYLIEDNCESMGAKVDGKQAGTYGICGTFSTYFSHHISTIEGGVVVTDDLEIYHLLLSLRSHGWTRHLPEQNEIYQKQADPFYESFQFILPGYNLRPMEINAAVGLLQLNKVSDIVEGRRANAKIFVEAFSDLKNVQIQKEHGKSSWFGFGLIFDNEDTRNKIAKLFEKNGIDCRPIIAGNILRHPVVNHMDCRIVGEHPNADRLHQCGLFIGNHHYPIKDEIQTIKNLISDNT